MKYIFILFVFIYIVGDLGHDYYVDGIDYLNLTEKQAQTEWILRLVRDTGSVLAVFFSIVWSLSNYPLSENKTKSKILIILSVTFCIALITFSSIMYFMSKSMLSELDRCPFDKHDFISKYEEQITSNNKPLSERIKFSQSVASCIYRDSGRSIRVINEERALNTYHPSSEDIRFYNDLLSAKRLMVYTTESLRYASYLWLSVLLVSILIGVIAMRRKNAYKQSLSQDAR